MNQVVIEASEVTQDIQNHIRQGQVHEGPNMRSWRELPPARPCSPLLAFALSTVLECLALTRGSELCTVHGAMMVARDLGWFPWSGWADSAQRPQREAKAVGVTKRESE